MNNNEETVPTENLTPNFTEQAYGLFQEKDGKWSVLEIKYDPVTLTVDSKPVVHATGESFKTIGIERFKILVGSNILAKNVYK